MQGVEQVESPLDDFVAGQLPPVIESDGDYGQNGRQLNFNDKPKNRHRCRRPPQPINKKKCHRLQDRLIKKSTLVLDTQL